MRKTIKFSEPSPLPNLGDKIAWQFPFAIVDTDYVGGPRESAQTVPYQVIVSVSESLINSWGFYPGYGMEGHSDDMHLLMKVLFEIGKDKILDKLKSGGPLQDKEVVDLTTYDSDSRRPVNPTLVQDPNGATFEIDTIETLNSQDAGGGITLAGPVNVGNDLVAGDKILNAPIILLPLNPSTFMASRSREDEISLTLSLKKRLERDLRAPANTIDFDKALLHPPLRFRASEVIIHSIDDQTYPEVNTKSQISGWFKLGMWDFYYNGLEFIYGVVLGVLDEMGHWSVIGRGESFDLERFTEIRMIHLAKIPFRNILDYDVDGDEYYPIPHFYCRFADKGLPFEGFRYLLDSEHRPSETDPDLRIDLSANSKG